MLGDKTEFSKCQMYLGGAYIENGDIIGYYGYLSVFKIALMLPCSLLEDIVSIDTLDTIKRLGDSPATNIIATSPISSINPPNIVFNINNRDFYLLRGSYFCKLDDSKSASLLPNVVMRSPRYRIPMQFTINPDNMFEIFNANVGNMLQGMYYLSSIQFSNAGDMAVYLHTEATKESTLVLPYGYSGVKFGSNGLPKNVTVVVPETVQYLDLSNITTSCRVILRSTYLPRGVLTVMLPNSAVMDKITLRFIADDKSGLLQFGGSTSSKGKLSTNCTVEVQSGLEYTRSYMPNVEFKEC